MAEMMDVDLNMRQMGDNLATVKIIKFTFVHLYETQLLNIYQT